MGGSPGARDQMKTLRTIAAHVAHEAGIADVAGQIQPDPRQGDARVRRETLNDGLQYAFDGLLGGDGDCKAQEPFGIHEELCCVERRRYAPTCSSQCEISGKASTVVACRSPVNRLGEAGGRRQRAWTTMCYEDPRSARMAGSPHRRGALTDGGLRA